MAKLPLATEQRPPDQRLLLYELNF